MDATLNILTQRDTAHTCCFDEHEVLFGTIRRGLSPMRPDVCRRSARLGYREGIVSSEQLVTVTSITYYNFSRLGVPTKSLSWLCCAGLKEQEAGQNCAVLFSRGSHYGTVETKMRRNASATDVI